MIRRPLNSRFGDAVREGRKTTTIRESQWPMGVPIQLYHWIGRPYRSKQIDCAIVQVWCLCPITITHSHTGIIYDHLKMPLPLWQCEGFSTQDDMDTWFACKIEPGKTFHGFLHRFTLHPANI